MVRESCPHTQYMKNKFTAGLLSTSHTLAEAIQKRAGTVVEELHRRELGSSLPLILWLKPHRREVGSSLNVATTELGKKWCGYGGVKASLHS